MPISVMMNSHYNPDTCLNELFRSSYFFHELTNHFEQQSTRIQDIAMNAAIAAGHAGSNVRVFSEIAKQIGLISERMSELVLDVRNSTSKMTNQVLESLVVSSLKTKYLEAEKLLAQSQSSYCLDQIQKTLQSEIGMKLDQSEQELIKIKLYQTRIMVFANRVWSLSMSLKTTSSFVINTEERTYFSSISSSLEQIGKEMTQSAIAFGQSVRNISQQLENKCGCKQDWEMKSAA